MTQRLGLVIVFASASCGESDLTVSGATDDLAVAACERIARCCNADQIECTTGHAIQEGDCEELVKLALRAAIYLTDDAVDEGRRSVDEDVVAACVEAIAALPCFAGTVLSYDSDLPEECDDMFPGEQGVGDVCYSSSECESGTRCAREGESSDRGICVPLQEEDEICFDHGHCDEGLYCSADGYVCRPRATEGSGCEDADDDVSEAPLCESGLACNDEERCEGPAGLGDSCIERGCERGLTCGTMDFECIEPLANGEPCIFGGECASLYCDGMGECADDETQCIVADGVIGTDFCEP